MSVFLCKLAGYRLTSVMLAQCLILTFSEDEQNAETKGETFISCTVINRQEEEIGAFYVISINQNGQLLNFQL